MAGLKSFRHPRKRPSFIGRPFLVERGLLKKGPLWVSALKRSAGLGRAEHVDTVGDDAVGA